MPHQRIIPRSSESLLAEVIEDTPIALIHGPRQCGKTTLAKKVGLPLGYSYYTFDDKDTLEYAQDDPRGFVDDLPEHVILDEVQCVPSLFRTLKLSVDQNRIPGRFILTGSTNLLLVSGLADAFVGRMEIVRLHPLSQLEIEHNDSPHFIENLFAGIFRTGRCERLKDNLAERIVIGGYPEVLTRLTDSRRFSWYQNYLNNLVQKDVTELASIHSSEALPTLLTAAANLSSQLFNVSAIASTPQMNRNTVRDYLILLERQFLIYRLPAWYTNQMKRLIKTPKIHISDTGIASALLRTGAKSLRKNRALFGQLVESFVLQELQRQASFSDEPYKFYHFRDQDGVEVDIIMELGAFELAGIEVKSTASVSNSDFKGLRKIKATHGDRFRCGVVLYDGEICRAWGDNMYSVPIRMLWESEPV
ncbi:MAG: ATP-binding protein [Bacteroidetes bacterium]|nr:ATP-binding protein [Bacteroidota bacterium]MCY4205178.1 ATP-binding protein [Bacteroidota bacterium]